MGRGNLQKRAFQKEGSVKGGSRIDGETQRSLTDFKRQRPTRYQQTNLPNIDVHGILGTGVRAVARGPQSRSGLLVGHAARAPAETIQGLRLRQSRAAGPGRAPDRADRDRPARLEPHGGVEIRVRGRRRHVRIGGRDLVDLRSRVKECKARCKTLASSASSATKV